MEVASGEYGSYVEKLSEAVKENPETNSLETSSSLNSRSKRLIATGDEVQIEIGASKDDNSECHNSLLVRIVLLSLSLSKVA